MLRKIIGFELISCLKNPAFYFYFLLMAAQIIWLTKGTYDFYINDAILINSSTVLYKTFAGGGMIFFILIAILTGRVLYKDIQYKTAEIIYTFPVNEKVFFVSKFFATFLINLVLASGCVVGIFLLPYSGIGKPEDFGEIPLLQIFQAYFILLVPNVFVLTSACFIPLVLTKKPFSSYLGILVLIILFVVFETASHTTSNIDLISILDPLAYVYTAEALDVLPTHLKNTTFLPVKATLLINRLLWFFLSFIGLLWAFKRFSFSYFIKKKIKSKKHIVQKQSFETVVNSSVLPPKVGLVYSGKEYMLKTLRLANLEFLSLIRSKGFLIIIGIVMLLFLLQNFVSNTSYYIGPEHPLTTNMTFNRIVMSVFIIILLLIWTGEIIFKEKTVNLWQISDTFALPIWVRLLSKYLAMAGIAALFGCVIVVVGLITQLSQGFTDIEWSLYLEDIFGYKLGWLNYLMIMTIPFLIAGITGKRFLTHIISVGYFIFIIISFDIGLIEDPRFGLLIGTPGVEDYSEISGYGIFSITSFWFFCLWGALAILFMLVSIYFWKSGIKHQWIKKSSFRGNQLNWSGKMLVVIMLVLFVGLQSFIAKNTKDNFKTKASEELEQADYEKKYKKLETYPQPIIQNIKATINLFPQDRKLDYTATFLLKNESNLPIDSLYINLTNFTIIESISINNKPLKRIWEDKQHCIYGYVLPKRLFPTEKIQFKINATKQYCGFSNIDPQEDLTFNGLRLSRELFPIFGYNDKKELKENKKRKNNGLPKINSKMPILEDSVASKQNYFSTNAHKVKGELIISTSKDQQVVSIGKTTKRWKENNRNYVNYSINEPSNFNIEIVSSNFAISHETLEGVKTTFWYKKSHYFNIGLYKKAIKYGLSFIKKNMGEYPYKELNIAEVPHYGDEFYTNSNLILISEKEGWRADTSLIEEESYLYFSVITQLLKQYLLNAVEIANVQGAEMLATALPQAIALQAIKQRFGKEVVDIYIKKKYNYYQKERGNEANIEPPLIYADGSDYLESNKGVVALYALEEKVGFEVFNQNIQSYLAQNSAHPIVFKTMYQEILKITPNTEKKEVKNTFENVK